jgi:hypothetical protein
MVCNTRSYWVFGLCPSSGILKTKEHNVSETGSVSVLRWGGEDTYSVGPIRKSQPQFIDWGFSLFPSVPPGKCRDNRCTHPKLWHNLPNSLYTNRTIRCCVVCVGFEVLTAVVMKSSNFWDITPCSPLKVNRRFGGTCLLHVQGQRIRQARSMKGIKQSSALLTLQPKIEATCSSKRQVTHPRRQHCSI